MRRDVVQLLRWSERYIKTDMVFLARGGALSILLQSTGILTSLAFAVAVSHFLPKEVYGLYKYVLSIVAMLSLLSLNGIGGAVFQSAAQGYDGALTKGFWTSIRWSALIVATALALSLYYFFGGNPTLAIGILIGGTLSPVLTSASLFGAFLGGKRDFYRQALYGIADTIVPVIFLITVVTLTKSPIILIASYFISNTLAALFFYRRTVLAYREKIHAHDVGMVSYGKHLSVIGIINGIATNIDQILLFHFIGAAPLAVYNFATAIPDQIRGPSKMLDSLIQAQFTRRSATEIRSGMANKIWWYVVACIVITCMYILLSPIIFRVLFPQYVDAIFMSQIYALWILTLAFDPFFDYLASRRLVREQYIIFGSYSTVQILGQLIGVIVAGVVGLIIGRLIARIYMMVIPYFLYRRAIAREVTTGLSPR